MAETAVSILERRRIEAELAGSIHRILVREIGREKADQIIGEAVTQAAMAAGRADAERLGRSGLLAFAEILPNWTRGGALETEVLESSAEALDYDVTRCRYAEMYREMGLEDLGGILSCERDGAYMSGFCPEVEMIRTKTIMGGADRCDFRYRAKKV